MLSHNPVVELKTGHGTRIGALFLKYAADSTRPWGSEYLVDNAEKHSLRLVHVTPGVMSPLASHRFRDFTFVVVEGIFYLEIARPEGLIGGRPSLTRQMAAGDKQQIFSNMAYRFWSGPEGALVFETGNHYDATDVIVIEESKNVPQSSTNPNARFAP